MIDESHQRRDVWLRGNMRPVVGFSAVATAVAALAVMLLAVFGQAWGAWLVVGVAAGVLLSLIVIDRASARPRLARCGDRLEVRLAPGRVEMVPLDMVECLFRGSEVLGEQADDAAPLLRVGTLVIRFAERAGQWSARPAFRPWGTWQDGYAVIDGRWCEPLSLETVQRIAGALLEAKREVAAESEA